VVADNASEESPVNVDHNELGQAVNVSVTLDQGGGVGALIPQSGGEISITMANGLIYTLTIPEGALLSDQEVTMTPIRSLDGTGLADGLIGGVQLEPDGTYLLEPAMLTISAPEAYNLRQMVGFAYHGQGESFHLYPAEGDGNTITLQLISFSGHGATTGTDQQIADQAGQATSSAADSFEQDIAKAMHDAKEKGGDISSVNKVLLELMKEYYDKTLKPTLQTAAKDDTQIDAAEMMYADWRYKAEVLGLENDLNSRLAEALDLLIKGLKNAYDKANQRCIADQNIDEGEHMLKRLTEIAVWTDKTGGYSLDEKIADFERCVRYELNLDSVITTETGANFLATTHATGDVIMKMDPSQPSTIIFKGTGELKIVDYSFELLNEAAFMNSLCVTEGSFGDGTLEVRTDPLVSPTGFPFKVAQLPGTLSDKALAESRIRPPCDLGYLRRPYVRPTGTVGYQCPAEPVDVYVRKGGTAEQAAGRGCLCNSLLAAVGLGQVRAEGAVELPLVTLGTNLDGVRRLVQAHPGGWTARDVVQWILAPSGAQAA
jgi:hypothetical protein